ncbi:hypothetical protein WN51_10911 [Melipona quadrifasciata]|uniref:Uncharacterized protein n=1 Tax=Melipona quadrifasciata TaxID=166423 RepID=A0A0M9A4X2_9HYME|nr:hypothetical protein WN51_10911 [Melipona quadrifasciata]
MPLGSETLEFLGNLEITNPTVVEDLAILDNNSAFNVKAMPVKSHNVSCSNRIKMFFKRGKMVPVESGYTDSQVEPCDT